MSSDRRPPGALVAAGQLCGLWTLAVAQPLFEALRTGEELVLVGWTPADIVFFALGLVLLPPALMVALEVAAGRLRAAWRGRAHAAWIGALAAVLGMYTARTQADAGDSVLIVVGVAAALAAVVAHRRWAAFGSLLTFLAAAPVVVVVLFLGFSPVSRLVFPDHAPAPPTTARETPVVLVVFDELPTLSLLRPDGRLDADAYPGLAGLARDATWFRNATSPYDFTRLSVPALLTGRRFRGDIPPSLNAHPDNLFTVLAPSHAVHALESVTRMCPVRDCPNNAPGPLPGRITRVLPALGRVSGESFLPRALTSRLPATHPLGTAAPTTETARFEQIGRRIDRERGPALFYLHVLTPHGPWYHLPSGRTYPLTGCCSQDVFPGNPGGNGTGFATFGPDRWTGDARIVAQARQRHLAQVRFADRLLGRLLDRLRAAGTYDRALVIVTADHGIAFTAGANARRLAADNVAEVLGVPLFVKAPGQRGGAVSDTWARTTDIAPTITAAVGIGNRLSSGGASLLSPRSAAPRVLDAYAVQDRRARRFTPTAFARQRARVRAANARLFGTGGPYGSLFAFGARQELLGRRPSELRLGPATASRATIDDPARLRDVDPGAASLPAYVSGVLGPGRGPRGELAVALNGRVVATTRPYRSVSGHARFAAFLPPAALRRGDNVVRLYELVGAAGRRPELRPLRMSGA